MTHRLWILALALTVETGCPDTWGKDGYVQRAAFENVSRKDKDLKGVVCHLSQSEGDVDASS